MVLKVRSKKYALREAYVLRSLQTRYSSDVRPAPELYDHFERFVLMECVGKPLQQYRLNTAFDFFRFLYAAAQTVHRCHEDGWVLVGVKPSNFTVSCDAEVCQGIDDLRCWYVDLEHAKKIGEAMWYRVCT